MKNFLIQWTWYLVLLCLFRFLWEAPLWAAVGFAWLIAHVDPLVED